jgi:hypothetical protein
MDEPPPPSTPEPIEPAAPPTFDQLPQLGQVELDRFCAGCGYNLRQQAVRQEPTTRLLLCQCPECGAFEPANQATTRPKSWFAQLVYILWLAWIAALGLALAGAIGANVGLSHETGELLNETQYLDEPIPDPRDANKDSVRTINFEYGLQPLNGEYALQLGAHILGAFAVGAGLLALAVLFVPHWPRKGYAWLALGFPFIALIVFYCTRLVDHYTLDYATHALKLWIWLCPLLIVLFSIAGGLTAICIARPIARLLIRILIPARQRGPFAYLWLVDDKTPQ